MDKKEVINNASDNELTYVVHTIDEIDKQGLNIEKTSQYFVAGIIVFDLIVSQSIFLQITQDKTVFKQVKRAILSEKDLILRITKKIYDKQTFWNTETYSLKEKIDISYQILGYEYLKGNFDKLYGISVNIVMQLLKKISIGIGNLRPTTFEVGNDNISGKDTELLRLSQRLNISYSLLFFSLRSRSQLGIQEWQKAKVPLPSFLNQNKLPNQKRLMFNIGKIALLLVAYKYCFKSGIINSIDTIALVKLNQSIDQDSLNKIFKIKELTVTLFDKLPIKNSVRLSDNDKRQVFENVSFSFFISNFNPDEMFLTIFEKDIDLFYREGFEENIDYRYAVLSFLGKLDICVDYKGKQNDNIYNAELIIGKKYHFNFEGQYKDEVKNNLWKKVYNNTIDSVEKFCCGQNPICSLELLKFIVNKMCSLSVGILNSLSKNMYIMRASSISRIGINEYHRIVCNSKEIINDATLWKRFVAVLMMYNEKFHICINSNVYNYSQILSMFDRKITIEELQPIYINRTNCISIYQNIVNPTESIQKKIIDIDYRVVKYIQPLSFKIAKYAIDNCLDSFNQMIQPSQEISDYYHNAMAIIEEENNIQQLISFDSKAKIIMFDTIRTLSEQLCELVAPMNIKKAVFACGYCFKSGLAMLNKIISKTIYANIPVQFVIGSLQKYNTCVDGEGTITGIDKATVQLLNQYLDRENVQLYTCEQRFYHGKIYKFESDSETIISIGSSNISRSAYSLNYELNIGFVLPNDSELKHNFDLLIQRVIKSSVLLDHLDENAFGENEINTEGSVVIGKLSLSAVQKRINELTNAEVKYRLNLWMSYSPDIVAENLNIRSLPGYIVFVYSNKKLMVLESFVAGNSYFCLKYSDSFEDEINKIENLSKTEIFQYSNMTKRGYHITNKFTLESNIRHYFV